MDAAIWVPLLSSVLCAALTSSGMWAFIQKRNSSQNAMLKAIMGLTYDKLVSRGLSYIDRGWITKDEFEDFQNYFYDPYKAMGGNGVAEKIMDQVRNLPFNNPPLYFELKNYRRDSKEYNNDGWSTQGNVRHSIEQPRI